jgi:DNA polymerase I
MSTTTTTTIITIDFETMPIVSGSNKMPEPVGVSIKYDDNHSTYYPIDDASIELLRMAYITDNALLLFHNAKFDLRVALEHLSLPIPKPERLMDTMIMAYLNNPRDESLGLKELSTKYLNLPPDEQDDLQQWLKANRLPDSHIYQAPFELLSKYAKGDTDRTYLLYQHFKPLFNIKDTPANQQMGNALEREMQIIPIVIDMEMNGVTLRGDIQQIESDLTDRFNAIDDELLDYGAGEKPGSKSMFNVLREKGYIDESKFVYTDKGNVRYGREFLEQYITHEPLLKLLILRSKMQKLLGTYVKPYAKSASMYDGQFYPYYNQTRGTDDFGTRTGRFSSNIQQMPKDKKDDEGNLIIDADLPSVRSLIVAKPGNVLLKRDFSGQELRVAAHYAEGSILEAYRANPALDVHSFIQNLIEQKTGLSLKRDHVKTISFLKLYRGGAALLANKFSIPLQQARDFFEAYNNALPEFEKLMRDVENTAMRGVRIRTWGGRKYDVEPSKNGQTFYYKMGNVLIQGSSADMTKEAMIRYYYAPHRKGNLLMTVHDELVVEVPYEKHVSEMELLRWAMDDIPGWDVPLRSDGFIGTNLGEMRGYND